MRWRREWIAFARSVIVFVLVAFVCRHRSQGLENGAFSCESLAQTGENEWVVDQAAVDAVDNDIQLLIDCIPPGGAVLFEMDIISPSRPLKINTPIQFNSGPQQASSTPHSVAFVCQQGQPSLEISSTGVFLSNLSFTACSTNSSGIVHILPKSKVTITNTVFSSNKNSAETGSISAQNSALTIENCLFEYNSGVDGGAVAVGNGSVLKLIESEFKNNAGKRSGAVLAVDSDVHVRSSTFSGNEARTKGGAIHVQSVTKWAMLDVRDSQFSHNTLLGFPEEDFETMAGGAVAVDGFRSACRIVSSNFTGNSAFGSGGALALENVYRLRMLDSTFEGNVAYHGGALAVQTLPGEQGPTVKVHNVAFLKNRAQSLHFHGDDAEGGAALIHNVAFFELNKCIFEENVAELAGGALTLEHIAAGSIEDCKFESNSADFGGGIDLYESHLNVTHTNFERNKVAASGGGIFADDGVTGTIVKIKHTEFHRNVANSGGGLSVMSGSLVAHHWAVIACVFEDNVAESYRKGGGAMFLTGHQSSYWIGDGTIVKNNVAPRGGGIHAAVILPGGDKEPIDITIEDTVFEGNNATEACAGAIAASERVRTKMLNVGFFNNNGIMGGALYVAEDSPTNVTSCKFWGNHAEQGGGAIYFENKNENVNEFLEYWELPVFMWVQNSSFINNTAGQLLKNDAGSIVFSVAGKGGAIVIHGSGTNTSLLDLDISHNAAGTGGGILWNGGYLFAKGVNLTGNVAVMGGGMFSEPSPKRTKMVVLFEVNFFNNKAQKGGGMAMTFRHPRFETLVIAEYGSDRTVYMRDIGFSGNVARKEGGGVYFEYVHVVCESCKFEFNRVEEAGHIIKGKGGGVSLGEDASGSFAGSRFAANVAGIGGGIYGRNARLNLTEVEVTQNMAWNRGGGVAMHFGPAATTQSGALMGCTSSMVTRNVARVGGGVHIIAESPKGFLARCTSRGHPRTLPELAEEHLFGLDPICSGIADFRPRLESRHIELNNSTLSFNRAWESGPALFSTKSDLLKICCQNECILGNDELDKMRRPCKGDGDLDWKDNWVTGGREQSVVSTSVHRVWLHPPMIKDQASAKQLPMIKAVFMDDLDQVVFGQNITLTVRLAQPNNSTIEIRDENVTVYGNPVNGVNLVRGDSRVTGITMRASPGNYTLQFYFTFSLPGCNAMKINLPVEVRECRIGETYEEELLICVPCDVDEYGFDLEHCKPCPANAVCTGATLVPVDGFWQETSQSPEVQECLFPGACSYTGREESLTINASLAHRYKELLHWNSGEYEQCAKGYTGSLCGSCPEGYGRVGAEKCGVCPDKWISYSLLLLAFAVLFAQTAFLTREALKPVKGTIVTGDASESDICYMPPTESEVGLPELVPSGASVSVEKVDSESEQLSMEVPVEIEGRVPSVVPKEDDDEQHGGGGVRQLSVSNRIPLRHRQSTFVKVEANRTVELLKVVGTAAGINAHWSQSVVKLFQVADVASGVATNGFGLASIECAFNSPNTSTPQSIMSSLFHLVSPFLICFIFAAFWFIRWRCHKTTKSEFRKSLVVSVLVILYVSYINLTKKAVQVYNCIRLHASMDPEDESATKLWSADTSVECFEGPHLFLMALVASPIMLLIVVGYPVGLILKLRTNRSRLNDRNFAEYYGFLYKAYRDHAVFWEACVLMRKGMLATIMVFSSQLNPNQQGTLATLVLLVALLLHYLFAPYDWALSRLNFLETMSLIISQFTFLCGAIFYQTPSESDEMDAVHVVLSVSVIGGVAGFVLFMLYELALSGLDMLEAWLESKGIQRQGSIFKDVCAVVRHDLRELKLKASRAIKDKLPCFNQ